MEIIRLEMILLEDQHLTWDLRGLLNLLNAKCKTYPKLLCLIVEWKGIKMTVSVVLE